MPRHREIIYTKSGEECLLEVTSHAQGGIRCEIDYKRCRIGYANCTELGKHVWQLADIHIDDAMVVRPGFSFDLGWFKIGRAPKTFNCRGRGFGSALLKFVIQYAKECDVSILTGSVTPNDLAEKPDRLKWYEHHGFRCTSSEEQCDLAKAIDIKLDINTQA